MATTWLTTVTTGACISTRQKALTCPHQYWPSRAFPSIMALALSLVCLESSLHLLLENTYGRL
jgi:hypothetical protein